MAGRLMEEHWNHVFAVCSALFALVVFSQFIWRGSYTAESLLEGVNAPEQLRLHNKLFDVPEVVQVAEGIYMAIGFGLANSILLEAPEGAIIIDTMESVEAGRDVMAAFRKVTSSAVRAIIYTHNHADHIYGASAFVEDEKNPPEVWSHHSLPGQLEMLAFKTNIHYSRARRQFGSLLPQSAHINSGIGLRLRLGGLGFIYPNKFLYNDQEDVNIAGLNLRLLHIPGETPDQIGVWYPDKKAFMCADDVYRSLPNLYAIRGTPTRNVLDWVKSVDKIRQLKPELLVPSHTRHVEGSQLVHSLLTDYRDAIQYIHDQTLRFMNKGYYPEDIVPLVRLPEKLTNNPWLYELYGTVEWSVRAVFDQYLGWFSGNIADLQSMSSRDRATKMLELGGGAKQMCIRAQDALKNGEAQWALELATHVLTVYPDNSICKAIRLDAIKTLAGQQTSPNGRNYYLTVALEDYKLADSIIPSEFKIKGIQHKPSTELFHIMRTKLMAENCQELQTTAVFNFTDVREVYTLTIRNGILEVLSEPTSHWDVKVTVTLETWKDILVSVRSPLSAYIAGDLQISGGITALRSFMGNFERD